LVLVGTFVALLLGLEESTVGAALLACPPPPHAGSTVDSSNAATQRAALAEPRLQVIIFVSISMFCGQVEQRRGRAHFMGKAKFWSISCPAALPPSLTLIALVTQFDVDRESLRETPY
jgi:hypothetical protein